MNFDHEELMLMMLYNTGTRLGLIHELRLMQCYLMPDETALRELSEGVIEKLKLLTDAEFAELEFPPTSSLHTVAYAIPAPCGSGSSSTCVSA